ncbi:hypothetical protein HHK36_005929 [Tetracentron sinense]|uniref:Guanine nucleotide-binding protein alpha-1 subunit n=1 Tax=Tetracentron sinense TaxID=13715 RepID=A0A834ZKB5_TETSI|nr:hypothetical protein HHK36_005929 [Tetracentron sinense]
MTITVANMLCNSGKHGKNFGKPDGESGLAQLQLHREVAEELDPSEVGEDMGSSEVRMLRVSVPDGKEEVSKGQIDKGQTDLRSSRAVASPEAQSLLRTSINCQVSSLSDTLAEHGHGRHVERAQEAISGPSSEKVGKFLGLSSEEQDTTVSNLLLRIEEGIEGSRGRPKVRSSAGHRGASEREKSRLECSVNYDRKAECIIRKFSKVNLTISEDSQDTWCSLTSITPMLSAVIASMGSLCSRHQHYSEADAEENAQAAEIERRIVQETKAEKHIHKLLLLGAGESGKSTIFKQARHYIFSSIQKEYFIFLSCLESILTFFLCMIYVQIKLLFQTGFDEAELKSYISVIHANVYQTIKTLHDGSKELAQNEADSLKYVVSVENKDIGEKLSEIGGRMDYPCLTEELANEIESLWKDAAIQETYSRGNELQVPDCAQYFMENLQRLSDANYVPTKEDVLYARVRTTGIVEIQFSPVGENKRSGEVYRLFDVGGQRNERRKWIHLFEGVTAVIFCAAISDYDQMLFEDENKNRMMETKELFDWVLKQPCFEKTSFMLFLNKFDIFEKKVLKVPLNVCEWFKDYQPVSTGKQEIEHAYEFVKKKFEELYFQSTATDRVDRVFKIYRTTALDQKLVKKTFKLVDETLRRRNLLEAGLL